MKKIFKTVAAALVVAAMSGGCTKIYDLETTDQTLSSDAESSSTVYSDAKPDEFEIDNRDFVTKLNAEGGVYEQGEMLSDGDFDGRGYLNFSSGGKLTHIVNTTFPQHYRFVLAVRSKKGAAIKFSVKDEVEGMFYVSPSDSESFGYAAVDNVYLPKGKNVFTLSVEKGQAEIDYIIVESSEKVDDSVYRTGSSAINPYASLKVISEMEYLSEIYGEHSLSAVNVSVGTNAEIDAVYAQTGRFPAIRGSELAYAVLGDVDKEKLLENDIELAKIWAENGGLVSYRWHWYSPNDLRSVKTGAFNLEKAFGTADLDEMATMTEEKLSELNEKGFIPTELYTLVSDIDKLAEVLGQLKSSDIPTIFEPLPNPDAGLYWWGESAENYKKLYTLVFNRLCKYHRLSNLIFVYSGSDADYYPGAGFCDIVGQNFFEQSDSSFAGRFSAAADALPTRKILAATACDVALSADKMNRDNALWLWCAIESGEYLIDENGEFSGRYNSAAALKKAYNSTLILTRDEISF